jgi:hypothetical protein
MGFERFEHIDVREKLIDDYNQEFFSQQRDESMNIHEQDKCHVLFCFVEWNHLVEQFASYDDMHAKPRESEPKEST